MSYTVLARRYRSQTFDDVVGQDAIARTLKNSIEQGRVAHAYLFVGTRGVGKTSMARIFAKALCGGTPEVDQAIMTGQDVDVIEIDAASNSKVDETRELIANCIYRPMRGKDKVYIIDEVHMLSTAAFNALLKTLEEPPEHVKFILCTTETHKVPATIQSRCQRFDFRNLSVKEIAEHLTRIADGEKVKADADVIHQVAILANGSMRDGLSLFDRLIAARAGNESLSVALLEKLLGLPERQAIAELVGALSKSDAHAALTLGDVLLSRGIAMDQLLETLCGYLRDLMVLATCGPETDLVALSGEARGEAVEQSKLFAPAAAVHMIALIESVGRMARSSPTPRVLFDALLVRLAMTNEIADATALATSANGSPRAASLPSGRPAPKPGSPPVKKR